MSWTGMDSQGSSPAPYPTQGTPTISPHAPESIVQAQFNTKFTFLAEEWYSFKLPRKIKKKNRVYSIQQDSTELILKDETSGPTLPLQSTWEPDLLPYTSKTAAGTRHLRDFANPWSPPCFKIMMLEYILQTAPGITPNSSPPVVLVRSSACSLLSQVEKIGNFI